MSIQQMALCSSRMLTSTVAKRLGLDAEKEAASFDFLQSSSFAKLIEDVHHPLKIKESTLVIDWQIGKSWQDGSPLLLNHYHYLDNVVQVKLVLFLSRYGRSCSHRYPIGFSGDTIVTWEP